ncbi:MAG: two-component system phosphate regulon sensor histidine kinase PhoR [Myxococcota bacterium]|jgi:two-component system phosphate regulon sensor histidine kinase PhoR
MIKQRRRLQLVVLGAGLLAMIGVVMLVVAALRGAAMEDRIRHEVIAQRLFDELERELTALVDREESRSFLEYRYFYVPEGQVVNPSLVRSPIAEMPADDVIVGYFQIDPDGQLFTPSNPRDNELELACKSNFEIPEEGNTLQSNLERLTATVDWQDDAPPPVDALAIPAIATVYQSAVQSLNRAQISRQGKKLQVDQVDETNFNGFTNNEVEIQQLVTADNWAAPGPAPLRPATDATGEQVDVIISPLRGVLADEKLLLHRTVRLGGQTYRQGLALDGEALLSHITQVVLRDSELAPFATLTTGPSSADYVFSHQFAEPFSDLTVTAALTEIPGAVSGQRLAVLILAGALLGAVGLGGVALRRMVAAELEFAERRNNFVSAVTHELRTPLTAIRMYGEMLRDGMVPSEDRRAQYYATITSEAERLSRLIENVLTLSRMEKGKTTVRPVVGSVGPILRQAAEVLGPHVRRHGFTLSVTVPEGLPEVMVDPDALSQVLVNLVDNAVKFSAESDNKHILLQAERGEGGVVLVVRDHGPGVPTRQLTRIFQPFFRGERELTRKTKGTGIGLALVAGLVDGMGGHIAAKNHPGGGLLVSVTLPVAA